MASNPGPSGVRTRRQTALEERVRGDKTPDNKITEVDNLADISFQNSDLLNSEASDLNDESVVTRPVIKILRLSQYKDAILKLKRGCLDFGDRLDHLIIGWSSISTLIANASVKSTRNLLYWLLRPTLQLLLVGEWTTLLPEKRAQLRCYIEETITKISNLPNSINRCNYILSHYDNPWGEKRLLNVLNGDANLLTPQDLDYLTDERGCMIVLRVQKLVETRCESMAFTLSSKALLALRSVEPTHELRLSTSTGNVYYLFDMFLCFVHKFVGVHKFIEEVKRLGLPDVFSLIRRNLAPEDESPRLLKLRAKVASLSANIIIATLMVETLNEYNQQYYCAILKEWLKINGHYPLRKFRGLARKLFSTACTQKHIYLACEILRDMARPDWREFHLELYVRFITGDLNELELLKSEKTCSAEEITAHEINLSYHYLEIANMLKVHHSTLMHECILTAFSLNPTLENYKLVEAVAQSKLSEELDSHSPSSRSVVKNESRSTFKCRSERDSLAPPSSVLDSIETIDLPDHIRIDLSVLLSSPRVKFLSWVLPWKELKNNCQRLLAPGAKLQIVRQSLAVANDHLQYLNLDYDQFRDLPESDGPGIEKGYEIFADSGDENSNNESIKSDENSLQRKLQTKRSARRVKSSLLNEKIDDSYQMSYRNPYEYLSLPLSNLANHDSGLISPFNTFVMQHLSQQQSSSKTSHLSREEQLDLIRKFHIQQLQAQLQLAQSYTAALSLAASQKDNPDARNRSEGRRKYRQTTQTSETNQKDKISHRTAQQNVRQSSTGLSQSSTSSRQSSKSLPQSSASLRQSSTSLPQPSTSLPQSSTSLRQSSTSLPQPSTSSPQSNSSLPQSNTSLLQSNTRLPQSNTSLPELSTSLPESTTIIPQSGTSVLQSSAKLSQSSSSLTQSNSSVSQSNSSSTQSSTSLTQSSSSLTQSGSGLTLSTSSLTQPTSSLPQSTSSLPQSSTSLTQSGTNFSQSSYYKIQSFGSSGSQCTSSLKTVEHKVEASISNPRDSINFPKLSSKEQVSTLRECPPLLYRSRSPSMTVLSTNVHADVSEPKLTVFTPQNTPHQSSTVKDNECKVTEGNKQEVLELIDFANVKLEAYQNPKQNEIDKNVKTSFQPRENLTSVAPCSDISTVDTSVFEPAPLELQCQYKIWKGNSAPNKNVLPSKVEQVNLDRSLYGELRCKTGEQTNSGLQVQEAVLMRVKTKTLDPLPNPVNCSSLAKATQENLEDCAKKLISSIDLDDSVNRAVQFPIQENRSDVSSAGSSVSVLSPSNHHEDSEDVEVEMDDSADVMTTCNSNRKGNRRDSETDSDSDENSNFPRSNSQYFGNCSGSSQMQSESAQDERAASASENFQSDNNKERKCVCSVLHSSFGKISNDPSAVLVKPKQGNSPVLTDARKDDIACDLLHLQLNEPNVAHQSESEEERVEDNRLHCIYESMSSDDCDESARSISHSDTENSESATDLDSDTDDQSIPRTGNTDDVTCFEYCTTEASFLTNPPSTGSYETLRLPSGVLHRPTNASEVYNILLPESCTITQLPEIICASFPKNYSKHRHCNDNDKHTNEERLYMFVRTSPICNAPGVRYVKAQLLGQLPVTSTPPYAKPPEVTQTPKGLEKAYTSCSLQNDSHEEELSVKRRKLDELSTTYDEFDHRKYHELLSTEEVAFFTISEFRRKDGSSITCNNDERNSSINSSSDECFYGNMGLPERETLAADSKSIETNSDDDSDSTVVSRDESDDYNNFMEEKDAAFRISRNSGNPFNGVHASINTGRQNPIGTKLAADSFEHGYASTLDMQPATNIRSFHPKLNTYTAEKNPQRSKQSPIYFNSYDSENSEKSGSSSTSSKETQKYITEEEIKGTFVSNNFQSKITQSAVSNREADSNCNAWIDSEHQYFNNTIDSNNDYNECLDGNDSLQIRIRRECAESLPQTKTGSDLDQLPPPKKTKLSNGDERKLSTDNALQSLAVSKCIDENFNLCVTNNKIISPNSMTNGVEWGDNTVPHAAQADPKVFSPSTAGKTPELKQPTLVYDHLPRETLERIQNSEPIQLGGNTQQSVSNLEFNKPKLTLPQSNSMLDCDGEQFQFNSIPDNESNPREQSVPTSDEAGYAGLSSMPEHAQDRCNLMQEGSLRLVTFNMSAQNVPDCLCSAPYKDRSASLLHQSKSYYSKYDDHSLPVEHQREYTYFYSVPLIAPRPNLEVFEGQYSENII